MLDMVWFAEHTEEENPSCIATGRPDWLLDLCAGGWKITMR